MSRLTKALRFIEGRPELVIEIILATALFALAVYLGGPWYVSAPTSAIGNTIEADVTRIWTALVYIIPALMTFFGVVRDKPKVRSYGTFGLFMGYLFATILRLLTVGFFPVLWIYPLSIALVAAVVYIVESRRAEA